MIPFSLTLLVVVSYVFVGIFRSYAIRKNLLDHPNSRSSHSIPVPRGGGIIISALWAAFLLMLYFMDGIEASYVFLFLPPVFLISLVSFFDDKYRVAARWRMLAHLIAVIYCLVVMGGFPSINLGILIIHWSWFGYVFVALALLWSTNLYNFMDGIDGIAAVEALFVLGVGGYFIWSAGGYELANIIWAVAAIVTGFLLWNKPPAKIFMGDVGSTVLGFLVVLFAIIGEKKYNVPVLLWVILYGVFWFDATLTLARRLINGDKCYQAHRVHAYQRLQLRGWSHGRILLGVSGINMLLVGFAFLAFYFSQYMIASLVGSLIVLLASYLFVEKMQPMYSREEVYEKIS